MAEWIVERALRFTPAGAVVFADPACGGGAFLAAARRRTPDAALYGLELSADVARTCAERLPGAQIQVGDALRGGYEALCAQLPADAFEVWLGNPPYNGTSELLKDKAAYARLRALFPPSVTLPRGTSLRDDFVFFLMLAAARLTQRPGVLAWVMPASLLDAFLYAPVRACLLERLDLREVIDLGAGVFAQTQVRTCVTIWSSPTGGPRPATRFSRRTSAAAGFGAEQLSAPVEWVPGPPDWLLRPVDPRAARLDAQWRVAGEPLRQLVPISFPGLKTRFDELLTADTEGELARKVRRFLSLERGELPAFAREEAFPERCGAKLEALHQAAARQRVTFDSACIRPFLRYAGVRHRGGIPAQAQAFCYLERRLIPRGDHRFRGAYDPHAGEGKLVFNTRELPLSALWVEGSGCVHDYQHARFAPLEVPEHIWAHGLRAARSGPLAPRVLNLSARGRQWASQWPDPTQAFRAIAQFINSPEVQDCWAPAFGATRELPVPLLR